MNTPAPTPPPPTSNWLVNLWKTDGTKLLGTFTMVLATVATFTPAQFAVYGIDGHTSLRIITFASGLLTLVRGFSNSKSSGSTP